ncbi:hypothetical protein SEA_LIBERTYBELL_18 [Streptomyces phage LibertyBell]|nr:hypothetical protein SEA_LIBERTYBELL_18 [Streptomyces phage LibertyBell]
MPYSQVVIDTFNGAAIDFNDRWYQAQGPGGSLGSGTLNMPCVMDYPMIQGKNFFRLSTGILAARLSATGTRAEASEFYIGAHDGAGNGVLAVGAPQGAYITFEPLGLATFNNEVKTDVDVGVGPSWVNGDWWGIGNVSADNILRMYKSRDGQTWTEMARCTIGGTFDRNNCAISFKTGIWNGTTTDLTARFDDASFWRKTQVSSRMTQVRVSGNWIWGEPMGMSGGNWVSTTPKVRDGSLWLPPL